MKPDLQRSVTPRDVRRCFEIMEIEEDSLKTLVAPKGLFVFAILTDMPPKTDVCASKSVYF